MSMRVVFFRCIPWILLLTRVAYAGEKAVSLQTIPEGATVEINGSISCTTPCSINVPDYYFGAKHTVFSKHGIEPIVARFVKEGYLPREIRITVGPIPWTNLNGVHVYDYYLVSQTSLNVQLEPEQRFFSAPSISPSPKSPDLRMVSNPSGDNATPSTESVVQASIPAVAVVSTADGWGSGFFISPQGVLVTNAHVIGTAQSVTVELTSGAKWIPFIARCGQTASVYVMDPDHVGVCGQSTRLGETGPWRKTN